MTTKRNCAGGSCEKITAAAHNKGSAEPGKQLFRRHRSSIWRALAVLGGEAKCEIRGGPEFDLPGKQKKAGNDRSQTSRCIPAAGTSDFAVAGERVCATKTGLDYIHPHNHR